MIDVSIIIPTFNRLWSLPDAIESCRNSACDCEIIVVDDGSTDGTWDWLQSQPNVISLRQTNLGKCWAVNAGVARARGEFVRFLDSDDMLAPGANDVQLAAARADGADLVAAGYTLIDEQGQPVGERPWVKCDDFIAQQLGECFSSHYSAYLFRRSFVEGIPHRQEYGAADDRQFIIEAAIKGPKVSAVEVPTLRHRHHRRGRLQFQTGLADIVKQWQYHLVFRAAERALQDRNDFTGRRRRAMAATVWSIAAGIAFASVEDGWRMAQWARELDPDLRIPERPSLVWLYRGLGFRNTARLRSVWRMVKRGWLWRPGWT